MREKIQTVRLDVRVHPDLKAQLIELARARLMTPSELVRDALRRITTDYPIEITESCGDVFKDIGLSPENRLWP